MCGSKKQAVKVNTWLQVCTSSLHYKVCCACERQVHAKYLSHAQIGITEDKRSKSRKWHTILLCMESTADSEMEEMLQQQECSPWELWEEHTSSWIQGRFGAAQLPFECKEIPQNFSLMF